MFGFAFLLLILIPALRRFFRSQKPLNVPEWEKDKVYLIQFPCAKEFRSISPFALKLETWLRLTKIPYESRYTFRSSSKGQIPYIEVNGQEIADSNLIMKFLEDKFEKNPDQHLDEDQKILLHTVTQMVENHTTFYGFYWRYGNFENCSKFFSLMGLKQPEWKLKLGALFLMLKIKLRFYLHGISRHSNAEMEQFSFKDLEILSKALKDKPYFFGDQITSIDALLFGHLVQYLYIPLNFPQKLYVKENCPKLWNYVDRIRKELWPDWEFMCDEKCMEGKVPK